MDALFWGETDDEAAKASLRQSLANLKKLVGAHLLIERDAVEFEMHAPYWLDVQDFERDAHNHVGNIITKLAVSTRTEAATLAVQQKLIWAARPSMTTS